VEECKPLPCGTCPMYSTLARGSTLFQGLTLVHFSAQLEPCLTQENNLHTLHTPNTPSTRATQSLRAPPIPRVALKLSRKVDECKPLPCSRTRRPLPASLSASRVAHSLPWLLNLSIFEDRVNGSTVT